MCENHRLRHDKVDCRLPLFDGKGQKSRGEYDKGEGVTSTKVCSKVKEKCTLTLLFWGQNGEYIKEYINNYTRKEK